MNRPKAQFQVDHGSGWKTIAEVDIIDGVAHAPNEWTMVRALGKRIVYTGYTQEVISVLPNPRDTHFAGFADQLVDELLKTQALDMLDAKRFWEPKERQEVVQLLARRAYDLAVHILNNMPSSAAAYEAHEVIQWIPDLAELPKGDE